MSRHDAKTVIWALVAGILLGVAITRSVRGVFRHGGLEQRHQRMADRLSRKLDLSAEQRAQLGKVLDAKRQKMHAMHAEFQPRFEEIRASTSVEIRKLLNADQQAKFDRIEAHWKAKLDKRAMKEKDGKK